MNKQPEIEVGILAYEKLDFFLSEGFLMGNQQVLTGRYEAVCQNNRVEITMPSGEKVQFKSQQFTPSDDSSDTWFELENVTIGVGFHWEQKENQRFRGKLKLMVENDKIRAINIIKLEDYLKSVISSEMSATSSPEFLKAHSVISRSWLLAQIEKTKNIKAEGGVYRTSHESGDEIIRWYDREDHLYFDVCADDHCQRYQGITKILTDKALKAVDETCGEVITSEGKVCDARFSKCCGGITENFEKVWEPIRHSYLTKVVDSEFGDTTCVDLRRNEEAEVWIRTFPHAFCNTADKQVLTQVLPDFDRATVDFYRWTKEYSQNELAEIIRKRSGIDFGQIIKLEPMQRGHSSRITKLKIHGTKRTLTVGKELEIRKWLSDSHLYSSAFVVDHSEIRDGIPQKVVLTGAGWGHGVGLCQIGAAVMGEKGFSYKQILRHYFYGAELKKIYKT